MARKFIHGDYGLSCRGLDSRQYSRPHISILNSVSKRNIHFVLAANAIVAV